MVFLLQENQKIQIKLPEKDPRSDTFIWTAKVLIKGHKTFVERHALNVSMQIRSSMGIENYSPLSVSNSDIGFHENGYKKMIGGKVNRQPFRHEIESSSPVVETDQECEVLSAEEVSRVLSEMEHPLADSEVSMTCSGVMDIMVRNFIFLKFSVVLKFLSEKEPVNCFPFVGGQAGS